MLSLKYNLQRWRHGAMAPWRRCGGKARSMDPNMAMAGRFNVLNGTSNNEWSLMRNLTHYTIKIH